MYDKETVKVAIVRHHEGNKAATDYLVKCVMSNRTWCDDAGKPRLKFLKNEYSDDSIILDSDIDGWFWDGVMKGLEKVRPDIGDPIEYLGYRGKLNVMQQRRNKLRASLNQICEHGHVMPLNTDAGTDELWCQKIVDGKLCGAPATQYRVEERAEEFVDTKNMEDSVIEKMTTEYRMKQVVEMLNPNSKSREIAIGLIFYLYYECLHFSPSF